MRIKQAELETLSRGVRSFPNDAVIVGYLIEAIVRLRIPVIRIQLRAHSVLGLSWNRS